MPEHLQIAGSLGVNYKTAQRYLDILVGSFMIRSLPTWTENVGKRVRKAPRIYLRDSGLFHALQRIPSLSDLQAHPKLGASWEADAPRTTRSMRAALDDLKLERLFVVYPGEKDYALDDRIDVLGLRSVERLGDATGGATTSAPLG